MALQKRKYRSLLKLLVIVAVAHALASANWAAEWTNLRTGDPFPRIRLPEMSGSAMAIPDDVRGKVAIIHFWAVGCSSCREEMPTFESLLDKYRKRGLVVIAVNVGQRKNDVQSFLKGLKIAYPILLDTDGKASIRYEAMRVPKTFILDRNGVIRYKIVGEATGEMLNKLVLNLL